MRIPYARPSFSEEDLQAAFETMRSQQWLQGEQTRLFEQELAAYLGVRRALFVNSGSSALLVAAHALAERGRGEVIVPGIQFPTLNNSLIHAGFQPVVVDIDDTLTLDPSRAVEAISPSTVGVAVVHAAGNIGHLEELKRIADAYGLWLLEDNCDGFGGTYRGKKVGAFGTISVTSFHVAHIISTGQGGGIFTDDEALADACVSYRDWGRLVNFSDDGPGIPPLPQDHMQRYTYSRLGFNLSGLELQVALGRSQLRRVDEFVSVRASNYTKIRGAAREAGFELPSIQATAMPAWFAAPIRTGSQLLGEEPHRYLKSTPSREEMFKKLKAADIEYRNILSGNISLHPAYRGKLEVRGPLTKTDEWGKRGFWVSCHSSLTEEEVQYVCDFFRNL